MVKNASIQKELFKQSVPVAAAQMRPNLISDFTRKYAKTYIRGNVIVERSDVWSGRKIQNIIDNGTTKLVIMDPRVRHDGKFLPGKFH